MISHVMYLKDNTFLNYHKKLILSCRVVLGSDDIVDCDEALLFEATARWLEHCPSERENHQNICLSLLRLVRFPIMDSCLLSDVIKGHPLMVGAERTNLLLEAFEHHALRWLTDWLTDTLKHWLIHWLIHWLTAWQPDRLTDWLTDRPTVWV